MQIVEGKALLVRTRNPNRITAVIPKSKQTAEHEVLVHWGLEEARLLNNLRMRDVPSPILGKYNWPGMFKPFEHQRVTAAFLTLNKRAFCFSQQGCGKSASAIWAADYLLSVGAVNRVLIIAPLSIMDVVWRAEIFKLAMHRRVEVAFGSAEKRRKIIASDAEFVVINYDGVGVVQKELMAGGFDLIIGDEANYLKNPSTNRWKSVAKLITPDTWLWLMTGTPAAQSPVDAYGLAKLVNPSAVPKFFTAYRDMVMTKITQFKWAPKLTAPKIVHQVLQPSIRYTKEECLDLPEQLYTSRHVPLTTQQKVYYDKLKKDMTMSVAGETITAVNAAVFMGKLIQVSCGAAYSDDGKTVEFDVSNRISALLEAIEESSHKVLVFVPYRHTIDVIQEKLQAEGVSVEVIHGDVPLRKRTSVFQEFQTTQDIRVLLIQPQTVAHGVTLTAANTVVWWGPVSSVETYEQANARVHRQGQRNPCTVVHLEGSPIERHVYALLQAKIDVHTQIIDLYNNIVANG